MFSKKFRQFKKEAKHIELNFEEKNAMRSNVRAFMNQHPVRNETVSRQIVQVTEPSSVLSFLHRKYMFATVAAMLVVLLTGGVSYAAEGSLPGQPLYPIKHINEEVKAALTVGPEADAQWDARRVERRLEEATTLASEGKLTTSTEATLAVAINTHLEETKNELKKLENEGKTHKAVELSNRLEHALEIHGKLISSLEAKQKFFVTAQANGTTTTTVSSTIPLTVTSTTSTPVIPKYDDTDHRENEVGDDKNPIRENALVRDIKHQTNEIIKITNKLEKIVETQEKGQMAAAGKLQEAKNKIEEAKKFVELKSTTINPDTKNQALAELTLAGNEVALAQTSLNAKNYVQTFEHATRAHMHAQKAKLIVSTQLNVKTNINVGKLLDENQKRTENKKNEGTTTSTVTSTPKILIKTKIEQKKEEVKKVEKQILELKKKTVEIKKEIQAEKKDEQKIELKNTNQLNTESAIKLKLGL